jgi:hypothetical protein
MHVQLHEYNASKKKRNKNIRKQLEARNEKRGNLGRRKRRIKEQLQRERNRNLRA